MESCVEAANVIGFLSVAKGSCSVRSGSQALARRRLDFLNFIEVFMYLFVVKLGNMFPQKLHYTLRDYHLEHYSKNSFITYTVYLSPSGKLCGHRGAAYLDSQELAQAFLDHYKPKLDNRGYGPYTALVERINAGKDQQRWLLKTKPNVLAVLDRFPS